MEVVIMKKLFGFMAMLVALFLSGNAFAQKSNKVDSFVDVLDKLATNKGISMPADLVKKAFEFAPIVRKGQPVTFTMGSDKYGGEKPAHDVTLTEPFEMQKTEITQLIWVLVMGTNQSYFKDVGTKFSVEGKDVSILYNRPVESVSYDDTQKFITKLNTLDSKYKYSLPTEAQWEYAARGGATTEYAFGDDASKLKDHAWYYDNSGERTHDVALKTANKFGLYDMAGNVSEWVSDYYGAYSPAKITDPKGPDKGSSRVMRGGSWANHVDCLGCSGGQCRSAHRGGIISDFGNNSMGFRLVRTAK
jgi:formylglycine-generating enzyme required for sulfatase activity